MSADFTHLDNREHPRMVDVSHKAITERKAVAQAVIRLGDELFELLKDENKQYTHNNNGVYINLEKISMKTIEEIENYLETVQKRKDYKKINEKLLSENAPAPLELKTKNLYDVFTYTQEYDPMYKLMNENQKMIIKETINKKK